MKDFLIVLKTNPFMRWYDLGGQDTAIVFIKWLENNLLDNGISLPYNFTYSVHSANPVGAENIKCYMNNIIDYFKEN